MNYCDDVCYVFRLVFELIRLFGGEVYMKKWVSLQLGVLIMFISRIEIVGLRECGYRMVVF